MREISIVCFWSVVIGGLLSILFVDGCAQSRAELDKYRPCAVAPSLPACLSDYDSSRFPEPIAEPDIDCKREVCA